MAEKKICPNCLSDMVAESIGWKCENCLAFLDMQGVLHEHKEKPFMPPMTNADRIRAMSDEELAKILNAIADSFEECNRAEFIECKSCELYKLCSIYDGKAMEWLKQPAEGD